METPDVQREPPEEQGVSNNILRLQRMCKSILEGQKQLWQNVFASELPVTAIWERVELALRQNPDMELKGVFTRRDPENVVIKTPSAGVYLVDDAARMRDEIDVMIALRRFGDRPARAGAGVCRSVQHGGQFRHPRQNPRLF